MGKRVLGLEERGSQKFRIMNPTFSIFSTVTNHHCSKIIRALRLPTRQHPKVRTHYFYKIPDLIGFDLVSSTYLCGRRISERHSPPPPPKPLETYITGKQCS